MCNHQRAEAVNIILGRSKIIKSDSIKMTRHFIRRLRCHFTIHHITHPWELKDIPHGTTIILLRHCPRHIHAFLILVSHIRTHMAVGLFHHHIGTVVPMAFHQLLHRHSLNSGNVHFKNVVTKSTTTMMNLFIINNAIFSEIVRCDKKFLVTDVTLVLPRDANLSTHLKKVKAVRCNAGMITIPPVELYKLIFRDIALQLMKMMTCPLLMRSTIEGTATWYMFNNL